jgi:hypothetical protein
LNKYKTIVADPPWKYGKWGKASIYRFDSEDWFSETKGIQSECTLAMNIRFYGVRFPAWWSQERGSTLLHITYGG